MLCYRQTFFQARSFAERYDPFFFASVRDLGDAPNVAIQ